MNMKCEIVVDSNICKEHKIHEPKNLVILKSGIDFLIEKPYNRREHREGEKNGKSITGKTSATD